MPGIQVTKSISGHDPVKESVHVTSSDATKANALNWIIKYLNIPRESVIGIGDSYNDKEFLEACGLKVAMGNSVPEIKALADYVAPNYQDDGVADVIEKYILASSV
jgi:hydroxymethylpyrimidine pyrophosphatase-like HAD family hydrolase